jgi:hypothetical protein
MVAGKDITGQVRARDVANVDLGAGIRPGDGNQNVFRHDLPPSVLDYEAQF